MNKTRLTGGEIYALHGEPVVRLPAGDVGVLPRLGDISRADGGVAVREAAAEFADLKRWEQGDFSAGDLFSFELRSRDKLSRSEQLRNFAKVAKM